MNNAIFVTGTNTDVGKTYISGLLAKKIQAGYYKPVLSGATWLNDQLIADDAKEVLDFCGLSSDPNSKVSYIFEEALSPHLSSFRSNHPISLEKIKNDFKSALVNSDYLIVEGAGGIICPLQADQLMLVDVIKALELPIIIVSNSKLGAINHVLLTVEYAKINNILVKGIIMNNFKTGDLICEDNKKMIEKISGLPVLDTVVYGQKDLNIGRDELIRKIFDEDE